MFNYYEQSNSFTNNVYPFIIFDMSLLERIKSEFSGFGKFEKVAFPLIIVLICILSFLTNDNKIALISAICGISYTILAGKGRISCYFIGIAGNICYCCLAFKNGFYGNLTLYGLYYLPMEIIGIFKWNKHLKKEIREIKKVKLQKKERMLYLLLAIIIFMLTALMLYFYGGKNPVIDAFTTVFSILGMLLTVKRCIEQWYIWFLVNLLSLIMWLFAYINGSNCLATVIMWFVYLILAVYFYFSWKKEIVY